MKEQIVAALQGARALVEQGWTQRTSARSSDGVSVEPDSPEACYWCPYGAVVAVLAGAGDSIFNTVWKVMETALGETSPSFWNDRPGRTKEEVLGMFDKAILVAQGQE